MFADLIILLFLIALNGLFSLSEMAVVSSRRQRLRTLDGPGSHSGVKAALLLNQDPSRFLSAVQIGITTIGVFAGALGGATLAEPLAAELARYEVIKAYADPLAFGLVVACITYLSLILGELVPKRIALSNPERIASAIARPMNRFTKLFSPLVSMLSWSTEFVLKIYGITGQTVPSVTEEEIKHLIEEGAASGAIENVERDIVNRVFRMGDQPVSEIMTPRISLVWLDRQAPLADNLAIIRKHQNLRYPVRDGSNPTPIGMIRVEDLFFDCEHTTNETLFQKMSAPLYIPRTSSALKALSVLQAQNKFMAFVINEYGDVEGTVSMAEIFWAMVGNVAPLSEQNNPSIVLRDDGSYLFDGVVPLDEVKEVLHLSTLPGEDRPEITTLAGIMFKWFDRLPSEGDYFAWNGYRFEIADIDGPRIDKILVVPAQNLPIGDMMRAAE